MLYQYHTAEGGIAHIKVTRRRRPRICQRGGCVFTWFLGKKSLKWFSLQEFNLHSPVYDLPSSCFCRWFSEWINPIECKGCCCYVQPCTSDLSGSFEEWGLGGGDWDVSFREEFKYVLQLRRFGTKFFQNYWFTCILKSLTRLFQKTENQKANQNKDNKPIYLEKKD